MAVSNHTSLKLVGIRRKSLADYQRIVGEGPIEEARSLADDLKGLRVLHLNSTSTGGGVAELLNSLVPLEADCGISVEWRLLCPDDELFRVTKGFHNALQGQHWPLDSAGKDVYLGRNSHCAAMLAPGEFDIVVVHDPQPAAIAHFTAPNNVKWVWRCHIDSSEPDPLVWNFLLPYLSEYDAAIFTMSEFVPKDFTGPKQYFIPPAIDPLSPKNRALPKYLCREEVSELGIDLARPLMAQVARFDPWKDPWGVIKAYRLVKQELPSIQLALIGSMAKDDPQGWDIYDSIREQAKEDADIHVLTNLMGVGAHEVNAFQRVADVIVQKSVREGFGLVVSEGVWKGTPVVAGNTGGIPLQIQDGTGGFLVDSVEECAGKVLYLLTHSDEAQEIARLGWERIRDHFLITRLLIDELKLFKSLAERGALEE